MIVCKMWGEVPSRAISTMAGSLSSAFNKAVLIHQDESVYGHDVFFEIDTSSEVNITLNKALEKFVNAVGPILKEQTEIVTFALRGSHDKDVSYFNACVNRGDAM